MSADDVAHLAIPDLPPVHVLAVPVRGRKELRVVVIARRRELRPFAAHDLALATDIARVAARALDETAANKDAAQWAEMFADFVATLSRELRDSVTALLTRLFLNEHGAPPEHVRDIVTVRRIVERMRDSLQRLDRALPPPPRRPDDPIDLAALASEIARDFATRMPGRARIHEEVSSVGTIRGDRHRFREALRAVGEHVIATASRDALICIRAEQGGSEIIVAFSRTGDGYDTDEARHLMDALWEGRHSARALTIARAVFAAHGGRAWVETAENAGVAYCFAVAAEARSTVA